MKCIPRASLSIAILDDEDFGVLMEDPGGMEAFGLFVAIVIAGRSRLQLERAERVGQTDGLVFADRTRHLLSMIHADQGQLDRCLAAFARVAKETGGEPWVHLDQSGRLVIRSFFKFNTNTGWGGARGGAGRKSSRNQDGQVGNQVFQDDSKRNHLEFASAIKFFKTDQLDSAVQSSGLYSGTGTGTGTGTGIHPPTPLKGESACELLNLKDAGGDEPPSPSRQAAPPGKPTAADDDEPFIPPPNPNAVPRTPGPGRDSEQAISLEGKAEKLGTDPKFDSYAKWARSACDYAPAEWIEKLLRTKVAGRGATRANISLLNHILGEWIDQGFCPLVKRKGDDSIRQMPGASAPATNYITAPDDYKKHLQASRRN